MRSPREVFTGNISNQNVLMELTDTSNQMELLKKLISLYEKKGVTIGARHLLNTLKGSFSFLLPFGDGNLFYCDFYRQSRIFKENIICNKKCRGKLIYIEDGKYEYLYIFYPLKEGYEPENIY